MRWSRLYDEHFFTREVTTQPANSSDKPTAPYITKKSQNKLHTHLVLYRYSQTSLPDFFNLIQVLLLGDSYQAGTFLFLSISRALPVISILLSGYPSLKHSNIASVAICLYFSLRLITYSRAFFPFLKYIVDNLSSIILHLMIVVLYSYSICFIKCIDFCLVLVCFQVKTILSVGKDTSKCWKAQIFHQFGPNNAQNAPLLSFCNVFLFVCHVPVRRVRVWYSPLLDRVNDY